MSKRRVAITGVGLVTSLGYDKEQVWDALVNGRSGIGEITLFDSSSFSVHIGGEVRDFDPSRWIEPRQTKRFDRFAQFATVAAELAVGDSGLSFDKEDPHRVGVIVGSGIGGLAEIETQHIKLLNKGPSRVSPFMIPKLMVNAAAGQISIRFGIKGPNSAVATACASGSHAIGDAFRLIQWGEADIMISGGTEAALTPMGVGGFCALKALSTRNDDPKRASRPFDMDRDGFVMGEGAGVLVIEELEHARARGAHIYCELLGYGMSGDGMHITASDPTGHGAAISMERALKDAKISAERISYVNAHGTSTTLGDQSETRALKKIFGENAKKIPISSTKSMLGHLLGASGGVELAICCMVVGRGTIPPTINYETPDPECDLDYVPNEARQVPIDVVMSNSFGFGGHNATLLVGKLNNR